MIREWNNSLRFYAWKMYARKIIPSIGRIYRHKTRRISLFNLYIKLINKKRRNIFKKELINERFDLERGSNERDARKIMLTDKIIARVEGGRENTWETRFYKRGQTLPIFAQAATNQIYIRSISRLIAIWFSSSFISYETMIDLIISSI